MKEVKKFNFQRKPKRMSNFWKPLIWAITFSKMRKRLTLKKENMDDLKTPYLLLSNHTSFYDFMVMSVGIYPHRANYVLALDGFYDYTEWLVRQVGGIGKRKFTNDLSLIKNMKYAIDKNKNILVLYPEARYSLDGTKAVLPDSLGKMVKFLKVPVVCLIMKGTYIAQPQWNKVKTKDKKKVPFEATMKQIITQEDIKTKSIEEINEILNNEFYYDDFKYQLDNKIRITDSNRADNLNKLLYKCPSCGTEHEMYGQGITLRCDNCQKIWEMDEYGSMKALNGETEFSRIPDWFEWERKCVRDEVRSGKYKIEDDILLETLPNAKKYYKHGKGKFVHDLNGFHLEANVYNEHKKIEWDPMLNYSVHIEYNFHKQGDALDISTLDESYWIFPTTKRDVVTKISLATEEIYKMKSEELKNKLDE